MLFSIRLKEIGQREQTWIPSPMPNKTHLFNNIRITTDTRLDKYNNTKERERGFPRTSQTLFSSSWVFINAPPSRSFVVLLDLLAPHADEREQ